MTDVFCDVRIGILNGRTDSRSKPIQQLLIVSFNFYIFKTIPDIFYFYIID
jgi:hypothetical protein